MGTQLSKPLVEGTEYELSAFLACGIADGANSFSNAGACTFQVFGYASKPAKRGNSYGLPDGRYPLVSTSVSSSTFRKHALKFTVPKAMDTLVFAVKREHTAALTVEKVSLRECSSMSIFVTNEAGDLGPFEYDVAPSTKIEDLKKRVSADVNMPVENIFFKAQKDDSKIDATSDLSGNNVVDKDTIYIYEPTMVVNVVDLDGNTHQYDVTPSTLVDDLKKNVSDDTGIPVDEVEIVDEDGAFLEDADLAYNLVNDKDTLYVHSFCSGNGKALDAFSDPSFEAIGAANGGVSGTSTPWYSINWGSRLRRCPVHMRRRLPTEDADN